MREGKEGFHAHGRLSAKLGFSGRSVQLFRGLTPALTKSKQRISAHKPKAITWVTVTLNISL